MKGKYCYKLSPPNLNCQAFLHDLINLTKAKYAGLDVPCKNYTVDHSNNSSNIHNLFAH